MQKETKKEKEEEKKETKKIQMASTEKTKVNTRFRWQRRDSLYLERDLEVSNQKLSFLVTWYCGPKNIWSPRRDFVPQARKNESHSRDEI